MTTIREFNPNEAVSSADLRDHLASASQSGCVSQIRVLHRKRRRFIQDRIRCEHLLLSWARQMLGYNSFQEDDDRKKHLEQAQALIDALRNDETLHVFPSDVVDAVIPHFAVFQPAIDQLDKLAKEQEKAMAKLVRELPVWKWAESVRGVAETSIGSIIGEAGDLSNFATPAKLRKFMAIAVINGHAQGCLHDNASADDWIHEGYVPRRCSIMWNIGQCMIRANSPYRKIYDEAKAKHMPLVAESKAPKMHASNRAWRPMVQKFLDDLWREWRRCDQSLN